jgi:hypothetical protein
MRIKGFSRMQVAMHWGVAQVVERLQAGGPEFSFQYCKKIKRASQSWLTPAILATWEVEIKRMDVQGQPGQIVHETPFSE